MAEPTIILLKNGKLKQTCSVQYKKREQKIVPS